MAAWFDTWVWVDYESEDLFIFATTKNGRVLWAAEHEATKEGLSECAFEFRAMEYEGVNPVRYGWGRYGLVGFNNLDEAQCAYDGLDVPGAGFCVANPNNGDGTPQGMFFSDKWADMAPEPALEFREMFIG